MHDLTELGARVRELEKTLSERDHQYIEAELLLRRVLDDEHFGVGLSHDIRSFLGFPVNPEGK